MERASFAQFALGPEVPAVGFDDRLDARQAHAAAGNLLRAGMGGAAVELEDVRQVTLRDPIPGVLNREVVENLFLLAADVDPPLLIWTATTVDGIELTSVDCADVPTALTAATL